jgi:RNA polymerase sigma-70 factor (ECF subfamily)
MLAPISAARAPFGKRMRVFEKLVVTIAASVVFSIHILHPDEALMMTIPMQPEIGFPDGDLRAILLAYVPPGEANSRPSFARASSQESEFEHFFRHYEPRVTGYLWRMTGNLDETQDLCQETFLRAWQQFHRVAAYEHQVSWLLRVATHLALNHARRPKAIALDDSSSPAGSDPGRHIVERDMVRQVLQHLPGKQRAMLILREVYGYSTDEIGQMLDSSPEAVRMGLSRARQQFRTIYQRKDR